MAHLDFFWDRAFGWASGEGPRPRRPRHAVPTVDVLEGRVVLSRIGLGERFGSAAFHSGTAGSTSPFATSGGPRGPRFGRGPEIVRDTQLKTDLQSLQTELQAVVAGSGVTDAQRQALGSDFKAIAEAGFRPDKVGLEAVADLLLVALADGSYDDAASGTAAEIEAAFTALFEGSEVDSALIAQTYSDFVAVARALDVSTEELDTLSADRAAIEADLVRLGLDGSKVRRHGPSANLDLILSPGFGRPSGRRWRF